MIAKKSYDNLADVILESIKGFSMSEEVFKERYRFVNPEISKKYTERGQCVIHAGAHYGNWEWGAISYPLWFSNPVIGFYKPLSHYKSEEYAAKKRGRFGTVLVQIGNTSKGIDQYKNEGAIFIFVSDQSTWSDNAHWVTFFDQDTACPQGTGKYSKMLQCPVFYVEFIRTGRGYYDVMLHELTNGTEDISELNITERFMQKLETILREKPEDWLWSHKRWKKKRTIAS